MVQASFKHFVCALDVTHVQQLYHIPELQQQGHDESAVMTGLQIWEDKSTSAYITCRRCVWVHPPCSMIALSAGHAPFDYRYTCTYGLLCCRNIILNMHSSRMTFLFAHLDAFLHATRAPYCSSSNVCVTLPSCSMEVRMSIERASASLGGVLCSA